jgi:hypothetical protein
MAGCDYSPDPTKALDASGLKLRTEAINYITNEKDIPWTIDETHPCKVGEAITGSGTSHWIIKTGFDNLGGLHYNATIISKGDALGASGKAYKISEQFKQVDQVPGNYTSYIIFEKMRLKVDGPSTDYDYYKTTIVKIVVNGNGEVTQSVDSESNSCT